MLKKKIGDKFGHMYPAILEMIKIIFNVLTKTIHRKLWYIGVRDVIYYEFK